jgi:hypothetical protein
MDNQELLVDPNQLEDHPRSLSKEPGKKTKISNDMSPTLLMKKSFKITSRTQSKEKSLIDSVKSSR